MANNFDDFNYDSDDPELDDNGLPIEEKMSPDDWMDVIRSLQDPDDEYSEDDEQDDDDSGDDYGQRRKKDADTDTSSKTKDGDGGRFGNNSQPQNQLSSKLSKPSTPGQGGGGSDWFSKLSGGGKASGQVAGKAAGKVAASSTASAGAAGSAASGALAAAAPYIGIALLIILAIILVIVIIVAIVSFFQGKSDPANMSTNTYVTSEYFYGTRSVYIDENELINSLQLSYKQYVLDVVDNFEENNPSIDITITLPELAE
ncbi:MAG: hypothetical protein J6Q15_00375, partial [Clostridia bacterium]|nr:hypothetical protein [Clostridia bacterium]